MALCRCHNGALACSPLGETFQLKQGYRQQIAKTVFKFFNFYSYIIFGVGERDGGGVVKIIKRFKRES